MMPDGVNEYFKRLGQLTQDIDRKETERLWLRAKKGDRNAKNKIVEMNLRLVIPTARRFHRFGIELMDLIEEGNLGLLQAIEKFDPHKGYRFSTYAIYWIEQYIRKYLEEQSGSIKIPSHAWGNLKKWFRVWNELRETNGREPTLAEMSQALDLTPRQVQSIMDTLSAAKGIDSLSSFVGEEEDLTLEELISDDGQGNPHDVFERKESMQTLQKSMEDLDSRDRQIVILRYGLGDEEPKTLGEVAELLGLSRERVRQIEERAIRTLRREAMRSGLLETVPVNFRTRKLQGTVAADETQAALQRAPRSPLARLLHKAQKMQQEKSHSIKKTTAKRKPKKTAKQKTAAKPVRKSAQKKSAKPAHKKTVRKVTKKKNSRRS